MNAFTCSALLLVDLVPHCVHVSLCVCMRVMRARVCVCVCVCARACVFMCVCALAPHGARCSGGGALINLGIAYKSLRRYDDALRTYAKVK